MSKNFITTVNMTRPQQEESSGVFVDLLIDGNFKLIMTEPGNKDILIALLNEVMPVRINSLTFAMQEQRGRLPEFKSSVFDLMCNLDNGKQAVIEVQYSSRADYLDRVLYYSTWPVYYQKRSGENNYSLDEVYVISFCNFALVHDKDWDSDRVISSYSIREDGNSEMMTEALHFIFIELERFKKKEGELKDQLESFLFYLKNMGRLKSTPEKISFKPVEALVRAAEVVSLSSEARDKYDANMRNAFDIRTEKLYAREEGLAEGRAEGKALGLAEGKAEGRAEGRAEGEAKARLEVAKKMLDKGMAVQEISEITGLSDEELRTL